MSGEGPRVKYVVSRAGVRFPPTRSNLALYAADNTRSPGAAPDPLDPLDRIQPPHLPMGQSNTRESAGRFRPIPLKSVSTLLRNTGEHPTANDGNVDFVMADPSSGFAFVADGVGHDYPTSGLPARQRDRMRACWDSFSTRLGSFLQGSDEGFTRQELAEYVMSELHEASLEFESFGKSSTFSLAIALSSDTGLCLFCVSIADSGILLLTPGCEQAEALVEFDNRVLRHAEVGGDVRGAQVNLVHVPNGSLVVGLTDGTIDAIAYEPCEIPPPPSAGVQAMRPPVPAPESSAYGPDWMARSLERVRKIAGDGQSCEWEPEGVLERLFDAALHATQLHSSSGGLSPDDCASFAFCMPTNNI